MEYCSNGSSEVSRGIRVGRALVASLFAVALLVAGFGCAGKDAQADKDIEKQKKAKKKVGANTVDKRRKRNDDLKRKKYDIESHDLNKDQQPDQWVMRSKKGQLVRIERDMNFDGQIDVWQYPNANGDIVEEEMDLDMDGTVDLIGYYENGNIKRKEMSVNFKEQFSIVKFYNKDGQLLRVERDEDGDQTTDVWEYYDDNGNRERVGWDDNGDGQPDSFDKLP